jgi:class 3 adenylate cyclase
MEPILYTRSGSGSIAYQVIGEGPVDLVCVPGLLNHIESAWDEPSFARHYRRLASFCRLVLLDRRGAGLSDRLASVAAPTIEERAEDIAAVVAAVGCEHPALFATADGAPVGLFFAATYPETVRALVLWAPTARYVSAPDYPEGFPPERFSGMEAAFDERWGDDRHPLAARGNAPSLFGDVRWHQSLARMQRRTATPTAAAALWAIHVRSDVRDVLPAIQAPTLVLHATGDQVFPVDQGRYVADHIANARFVELNGSDHLYWAQLGDEVAEEIEEFLTGVRGVHNVDTALATVVFTDLVRSTERAAELGDRRWRDLLDSHDTVTRRHVGRFLGRAVNTTGDGFIAEFDAPGRAISCALAIRDDLEAMGLAIRVGIHTGEVERRADDVGGIAAHIAARVQATAEPGEVLVSRTVHDLLAGSVFKWTDRGLHHLKGLSEDWQLYRVDAAARGT